MTKKRIAITTTGTQEELDIIQECRNKLKECRGKEPNTYTIPYTTQDELKFIKLFKQYLSLIKGDKNKLKKNIEQFTSMIIKLDTQQ